MLIYKEKMNLVTFWFGEISNGSADRHARRAGENPGISVNTPITPNRIFGILLCFT